MADDLFDDQPYPASMMSVNNRTHEQYWRGIAAGPLFTDQVKVWSPTVLRMLDKAAGKYPFNVCFRHLKSSLFHMKMNITMVIEKESIKIPYLTEFFNDGFKESLEFLVIDAMTRGIAIINMIPISEAPPIDFDLIGDVQDILLENAPEGLKIIDTSRPGKYKSLVEIFSLKPYYRIERIDPASVTVQYLAPLDGGRPRFLVIRKNGDIIPGARVIHRPTELRNDGAGNLIIQGPVMQAWEEMICLRKNLTSADTRADNMTAPYAFEPDNSAGKQHDQAQMMNSHFGGTILTVQDQAELHRDFNKAIMHMGSDAHRHNVIEWLKNTQLLKFLAQHGLATTIDPNYTTSPPIFPNTLTQPAIVAPKDHRVVSLNHPPESHMTEPLIDRREERIFAICGVSKNVITPPEVMGKSSFHQLQEYAKGVSEDTTKSIERLIKRIAATITMGVCLPHIIAFIDQRSQILLRQAEARVRKEEALIKQALITLNPISEEEDDEDDDGIEDVDIQGAKRSRAIDLSPVAGDNKEDRLSAMDRLPAFLRPRKRKFGVDGALPKDEPPFMQGMMPSFTGMEGAGSISMMAWTGTIPPVHDEVQQELDLYIASVIQTVSLSVSINPMPGISQQEIATKAYNEGFLPAEEMASYYSAALGIPVSKMNIPQSPYELARERELFEREQQQLQPASNDQQPERGAASNQAEETSRAQNQQKRLETSSSSSSSSSPSSSSTASRRGQPVNVRSTVRDPRTA